MSLKPDQDPHLLGLDLGISSIKAALFRLDGTIVALENVEHLQIPEGRDIVEIDAEAYWQATLRAIRNAVKAADIPVEQILALSVSSHGETLFCLDKAGHPLRPGILTLDTRARAEAAALVNQLGHSQVFNITGQPEILPIWTAAKIAWLKRHEPETYRRTARFLLPQGYVLYRLCGEYIDDPSVETTSLLLDIRSLNWSQPLLAFAGIEPYQLPQLVQAGTAVGSISARISAETGLTQGTQVVVGGLDQLCAAVGAGNIRPGILTESTGSVLALVTTTEKPTFLKSYPVPCQPHVLPGLYCLLPWHQTGGLVLKWFKERFGGQSPDAGNEYAALLRRAAEVPAGADGLLMLPYLEGSQFPESAPFARGAFCGFGLRHTQGHFLRAILEAIAFMIRRDIEVLRELGFDIREVVALGGGAQNRLWVQIKADVCNIPFRTLETEQAALLGAAILGAAGAGLYQDVPAAVAAMSRPGPCYEPHREVVDVYERVYRRYLALHQRLTGFFDA